MPAQRIAFPWSRPRGYGIWATKPHSHGPFTVARKMAQGAGAGLLVLSGADALVGEDNSAALEAMASTSEQYDLTNVNGLTEAFLAGAFNEPLQIAGAIFVFLSAGQCIARFFGLAAVILAFILHSQGVTLSEVIAFVTATIERIEAATTAFANPALVDGGRVN